MILAAVCPPGYTPILSAAVAAHFVEFASMSGPMKHASAASFEHASKYKHTKMTLMRTTTFPSRMAPR